MIYKTTTIKTIVMKARRDFNLTGSNWIANVPEWCGEALCEIGQHAHLERLSCDIPVTNFRAALPCNHQTTLAVAVGNYNLPKSQGLRQSHINYNRVNKTDSYPLSNLDTNGIDYQNVLAFPNYYNHSYHENPDYIIASFESGTITLHYQGYKLDEEGFPVIPDSVEHREALIFYILYKYLSRGNQHPVWNIKDAMFKWIEYKNKATNRAAFPDIPAMESFANMWTKMNFDKFAANTFFEGTENKQYNEGI